MTFSPGSAVSEAGRVIQQVVLVSRDVLDPDLREVVERGAEADRARDVRRARLELVGQDVVRRLLEGDRADHVAAALVGRHRLEQLRPPVEDADARRAVHLVRGERVEVAAELADVHGELRDRLRAVDEDRDAARVGDLDDPPHGDERAERVRDVGDRDDAACAA